MRIQKKTVPMIVGVLTILLGVLANYSKLPESKTGSEGFKLPSIQVNGGDQNVNVSPDIDSRNFNRSTSDLEQNDSDDSRVKRNNPQSNQEEFQKSSSISASHTPVNFRRDSNSVQQGTAQNAPKQESSLRSTVKSDRALPQLVAQAAPSTDSAQSPGVQQNVGNGSHGNSQIVGNNNTSTPQVKVENHNRNIGQVNGPYVEVGGSGAICGGSSPTCGGSGSTFNNYSTPPQR